MWHLLILDFYEVAVSRLFHTEEEARAVAEDMTRTWLMAEADVKDVAYIEDIKAEPLMWWNEGEGCDFFITEPTPA